MPSEQSNFAPTRWTQVLAARGDSPEAREALGNLCSAYYGPVVAFLRRSGHDDDSAREQAHGFFEHILGRDALQRLEPGRGRFRSYLLAALKHFLAHQHERVQRQKRGAGRANVSLDAGTDTSPGWEPRDQQTLPPDQYFDRQWALALLDRALARLEADYVNSGRRDDFLQLKPWLTGEAAHGDQASQARALGLSESAFKVAVHRFRRRFRENVKTEIAQTVQDETKIDDEMQELFAALGGSSAR